MNIIVLVVSALATAGATSAAYLPAGASPLQLGYSAAPVQTAGLPFYPYGVGSLLQAYPYPHPYSFPYVPAAPATVALTTSAAPAAPAVEQKSLAPVAPAAAPAVPAVPEVQPAVDAPKPVEETPEVKQARESFMALWLAAAKAAAESPDTGDASASEPAASRRRRDVTGVVQPAVRSWAYGASLPSYSYSYSAPLSVASPHAQSSVYPGAFQYYY